MKRASLPMYDWPEVRTATDAWWRGLKRAFEAQGIRHVPETLERGAADDAAWTSKDLLLSQTCGYPYTHGGSENLRLLATPCYDVEGCDGPEYQSFLLCRDDAPQTRLIDFKDTRAAINDNRSQSGYSALRAMIAPMADGQCFFKQVITSGGHRASMKLVGEGKADLCAVDAVCYALAQRYVPDLTNRLRIIGRSPSAPVLPYVTARRMPDGVTERLRAGLMQAMIDPDLADVRRDLFLSGAEVLGDEDYQRILEIEETALDLGYPDVR